MPDRLLFRLAILGSALLLGAASSRAGETVPLGVVELFTSQGCASCPPADAALRKLVESGKVIALGYHIDYWNFRGWADTLATKENTARQYAYSRSFGKNGVYTPQAVLNGREHMNGGDLAGINRRLDEMQQDREGLDLAVAAIRRGDEIDIEVGAQAGGATAATKANVVAVYFAPQKVVTMHRGENNGRTISYMNAVRDVQTIGMWDGTHASFVLPATVLKEEDSGGVAILVQQMKDGDTPGPILGATVLTNATTQPSDMVQVKR
ncbi:hypothetical protein BJF92_19885 [Rhizobium rhizosphaerae]|uniref:DUF1223 domain-containing protein n=1 Tax=Xaviernesmea rhizosphaerae TaxID=1672749 RepID=A0A1Q9AL96_9HYPH|nr:DUF1223 domain-containing protein [Xaviernesmea rhizosphaerae]OLP56075.1 hypothetical protein BJF92_19885 [Xaviernesmea rhizosphaerae]